MCIYVYIYIYNVNFLGLFQNVSTSWTFSDRQRSSTSDLIWHIVQYTVKIDNNIFWTFSCNKNLTYFTHLEKKTLSLICFYKVYNFSQSNDYCWLILRNILEGYKKQKFETIIYIFADTTFSRCTMFGIFLFKFCYISVLVRYIRNYRCSENRNRCPTKNSLFTWKTF